MIAFVIAATLIIHTHDGQGDVPGGEGYKADAVDITCVVCRAVLRSEGSCPDCKGSGRFDNEDERRSGICPRCDGSGGVLQSEGE